MASVQTLKVAERLAPFLGAVGPNPLRVFSELGTAVGNAAKRQRIALEVFQSTDASQLDPGNEAWLLNPMHSPVPFQFRDEEITDFKDWFYDNTGAHG